ncbi:MAG: molecular chaperone TorD family protein [Dehalococcoidia bacterium]|nr:molecular chaperone TorD family protein [Dehalococcoidia bacterium]
MSTAAEPASAGVLGELPLWRAAMYRALSLAFTYPGEDTVEQLVADLEDLCAQPLTTAKRLLPAAEALLMAARSTPVPELATTHNDLFAGEVACSPYETEYEFDAFAKARQLADIAGFYRAFGLKTASDEDASPADFVATELDFLAFAALKFAYAEAQGWDERAGVARDALKAFLEDHAGQWLPVFCRTLVGLEDVDSFYGAAACLCDEFIQLEIEYLGAKPRPAMVRRASHVPDEVFTCPMAGPAIDEEEDLV